MLENLETGFMLNSAAEGEFNRYRDAMNNEGVWFASSCLVLGRLCERRSELNIAPVFFRVTMKTLAVAIVLWADKFFDKNGQREVFDFLGLVQRNIDMFATRELQRRRGYPDDHWMLAEHKPVTLEIIESDRRRVDQSEALRNIGKHRDKYFAHFDKEYFFDPTLLNEHAPVSHGDVEEILSILKTIVNRYSAAFDGRSYSLQPVNVHDIDRLLDRLQAHDGD